MLALLFAFALLGCTKDNTVHPCYDASLVHDGPCTTDCPGFEACDGNTYCNECEAARHGFGPKK